MRIYFSSNFTYILKILCVCNISHNLKTFEKSIKLLLIWSIILNNISGPFSFGKFHSWHLPLICSKWDCFLYGYDELSFHYHLENSSCLSPMLKLLFPNPIFFYALLYFDETYGPLASWEKEIFKLCTSENAITPFSHLTDSFLRYRHFMLGTVCIMVIR